MTFPDDLFLQTPLIESFFLSKRAGVRVFLKLENLQPSGAFKMRGISRLCQHVRRQGASHFISSSGGNAGFTAAYVANQMGAKATVVVPVDTSDQVISKLQSMNAEVKKHGRFWDEAHQAAKQLATEVNGALLHPFDHPVIWEGHSTMIDEAVLQMEKPGAVILTVGGGGLLSGVAMGLRKSHWADVPIIAVETIGADSLSQAIKAGKPVRLSEITSIAKTLGASQVCDNAFRVTREHKVDSVVVTDQQAVSACISFAHDHRFLVEPACGAALSLIYSNHPAITGKKSVLVIVCGGISFTTADLK